MAHTAESELNLDLVTVTVTPELSLGYGKITAERVSDEEARARAEELGRYLRPVSPDAGCGCIDGRCLLHSASGEPAELGSKMAGGGAISTFYAAMLEGYFNDDRSALEFFADIAGKLEDDGKKMRIHGDTNDFMNIGLALQEWHEELDTLTVDDFIARLEASDDKKLRSKTGCGFSDGLEGAMTRRGSAPVKFEDAEGVERLETEAEAAARVDFIRTYSAALTTGFNNEVFDAHTARADELIASGYLKGWSNVKAALVMEKLLRDRGHAAGAVLERVDVLEASHRGFHGHFEDLVGVSDIDGYTLDTSAYYRDTKRQAFAYDNWEARKYAAGVATGPSAVAQAAHLHQGIVEAQFAGYVGLGDGTQRGVVYGAK